MHPWSMWVNCKITNISNDLVTVKSKKAHYYIFETVQTQYYNKNGKLTSYTCTARVNKHDIIESIISQLQILSEQYLFHRFFIVNDTCYWKKFLHKTEHHTLGRIILKILPLTRKNKSNQLIFWQVVYLT